VLVVGADLTDPGEVGAMVARIRETFGSLEILVLNVRSELVELHVDFAGQIYKQVWLR